MNQSPTASSKPQPDYTLFVGMDVSLKSFSVAVATSFDQVEKARNYEQSPQGFEQLHQALLATEKPPHQVLVVMEATNTYWMKLAWFLHQAGFATAVINPLLAHSFGQTLLRRSKTDALDAKLLAQLAEMYRPKAWSPPPAIYEELQQRLAQRDALIDMRTQESNRWQALLQRPFVIDSVAERAKALLAYFEQQIAQLDREIGEQLTAEHEWKQAAARLQSVKGLGPITIGWILVSTLAFANCPRVEQAAALAGLAPNQYSSGSSVHRRASIGHHGDGRLRQALYMATLSACQHNPHLKAFFTHLGELGKPNKVKRCAAARKLLSLAWTVVMKDVDYDPTYGLDQTNLTKSA